MPRVSVAAITLLAAGCSAGEPADLDEPQAVAAATRIPANDLLEVMSHDLGTIAPADRANVRYVTLAHLHDAGASRADLEIYRAAMGLALNSVSSGRSPTVPVPIDANATVFRIRLDDYGWDATTWQRLVDRYPYNVRYDADSPWFEFREDLADELRAGTETAVPYVHGDWLVSASMQPPLYDDLLGLPDTLDGLERQLGIDTVAATDDERVDRAGFVTSEVSPGSRMLARFELPDRRALWTSCDLAEGSSILDEPVDPICERREVMFTLPNGLPAYYVASPTGARQNLAGLSCASCHSTTGVIPKLDEVRDHALSTGASDLGAILALYPSQDELSDRVTHDQSTFVAARRASGAPDAIAKPLDWVSSRHDRPLNARDAAATLGFDEDTFREMLAASTDWAPDEVLPLLRGGGELPRDTWNRIFPDLVSALDLGTSCDPRDGGVCSC